MNPHTEPTHTADYVAPSDPWPWWVRAGLPTVSFVVGYIVGKWFS